MRTRSKKRLSESAGGFLVLGLLMVGFPGEGVSQVADGTPTFSADIAPILQASCQACHNSEGIAPMSLMNYAETRPWAPMIQEMTQMRHMPPWHVDKTMGIQDFKNDISLTDEEIETIARWAEAGAPEGNPADLPEPLAVVKSSADWAGEAEFGRPPDVIVRSTPFTVPANSQDQWWDASVPFEGLDEERWLMAAEFKPTGPDGHKVVHHGHAVLNVGDRQGIGIARYGVGKSWEAYPADMGVPIPAGPGTVEWNIHYSAIERDVPNDVIEVGLWFYPRGEEPRLASEGEVLFRADNPDHMRGQDILIPPHGYQVLSGIHKLESAAVIHSVRAHMHTRGKTMTLEAIYPDGRREVLSQINNYDHNWQNTYTFADDARALLPKGTVIMITSVYDNTADNPINPDPDQWVIFGRRGPDEMNHMWIGITYVPDEEFERLVSEREGTGPASNVAAATGN